MLHIILKSRFYIIEGDGQIGLPLRFFHFVDVQANLAVVGGEEAAFVIVDSFFHIDGTHKAFLCILIGKRHIAGVLRAAVNGGTDEKYVCGLAFGFL